MQQPEVLAEEADGGGPDQEGEVADSGDGAHAGGGRLRVVGGSGHPDGEAEGRPEAPGDDADYGHPDDGHEDHNEQADAGQHGTGAQHGNAAETVEHEHSGNAPDGHGRDEDTEDDGAVRIAHAVAVDHREGEPVVGRALGEGHAQDDDADEQGAGIAPDAQASSPTLGEIVVRDGFGRLPDDVLGLERPHREDGAERHQHADDGDVHDDRDVQALGEGAERGADDGATAECGMEQGHDGPAEGPLVGRARHVHCDIAHAEGAAEEHERGEDQAEARADGCTECGDREPDRAEDEAPDDRRPGPEAGDDVAGCDEPDDRAGRDTEDQPAHLLGAGVERVAHGGEPGDPARHADSADAEDDEDGVSPRGHLVPVEASPVALGAGAWGGFRHGVPGGNGGRMWPAVATSNRFDRIDSTKLSKHG